jgi:acetyltransferase-like isoleucine patch superfamily enzyme
MSIISKRHMLYRQVERLLFSLRLAQLRRRKIKIAYGLRNQIIGLPRLQLAKDSGLRIGNECTLRSKPESNPIGIDQPISLCTLLANAKIVIGDRVGISGGSICARQLIEIGSGTLIGANTYIFDNDFHALDPIARASDDYSKVRSAPIRIGSNVFIGARCIILKGVTIGDNSIVRAGSVVTQSIPANVIAAGNPCKVCSEQ